MNVYEMNLLKRRIVARAWTREKDLICTGKATRNWGDKYQEKILELNKYPNYVAHFVSGVNESNDCKIQFLDFYTEYLLAHSEANRNIKFSYFDCDTSCVLNKVPESLVVELPNPACMGFNYIRTELFAGRKNRFGIEIHNPNKSKKQNNAERFGLKTNDNTNTNTNNNTATTPDERKNKFGF